MSKIVKKSVKHPRQILKEFINKQITLVHKLKRVSKFNKEMSTHRIYFFIIKRPNIEIYRDTTFLISLFGINIWDIFLYFSVLLDLFHTNTMIIIMMFDIYVFG